MKSKTKYLVSRKGLILFLLVLFFRVNVKSQTTFDINDPRNPNCPCHKYQKIAEEEYKLWTMNAKKSHKEGDNNQNNITKSTRTYSRNRFIKRWSKHVQLRNIDVFNRRGHKHKRIHLKWKSLDSCFSWK